MDFLCNIQKNLHAFLGHASSSLNSSVIICKNIHLLIVSKTADLHFVMQIAPNIGYYSDCLLLDDVSSCLIDVSFSFPVIIGLWITEVDVKDKV